MTRGCRLSILLVIAIALFVTGLVVQLCGMYP